MLSDLCAQMALLCYIMMFAAAIKLRYSQPDRHRGFVVPGGNIMMWIVSGAGLVCCALAMLIGFVPPSQIPVGNVYIFEGFLIGGLVLFVLIPWMLAKRH